MVLKTKEGQCEIAMVKLRKSQTYAIVILVLLLLGVAFFFYYSHVKKEKTALKTRLDYYNSVVQSEQKWLAGLQQSNGALAFRDKENGTVSIVPYFSSITAMALLQKAPDLKYEDVVIGYFDWHFAHLNDAASDKSGVPGTIYNYNAEVLNGVVQREKTEQEYDSTDSYAAFFLIALWEYYEQSGNAEYLMAHYGQITDVIGAMKATIDKDGLSYTKPSNHVKYLMDNTEVYQGVSCAINLFEQVFLPRYDQGTSEHSNVQRTIAHLKEIKQRQKQALSALLWNEAQQRYETGINNAGAPLDFTGWTEFYPDAVAQLFPVLFGVLDPDSERARNLYHTFGEYFDWEKMAHYEKGNTDFYWGLTAYSGALMRDEEKVRAYLDYYMIKVAPNHKYPAYNADVAWVVLASAEMARFYQEQMDKIDPLGIVKVQ